MSKDKKIGARFGSRYGRKIRQRVHNIEKKYKYVKQVCPFCGKKSVKREAYGIYHCLNCDKKFAGGAYEPSTLAKRVLSKIYDKYGNVHKHKLNVKEIEKETEEIEKGE
jgi:large subunit ribosomal protein L37Ae